jgi:hypothetical protein
MTREFIRSVSVGFFDEVACLDDLAGSRSESSSRPRSFPTFALPTTRGCVPGGPEIHRRGVTEEIDLEYSSLRAK